MIEHNSQNDKSCSTVVWIFMVNNSKTCSTFNLFKMVPLYCVIFIISILSINGQIVFFPDQWQNVQNQRQMGNVSASDLNIAESMKKSMEKKNYVEQNR